MNIYLLTQGVNRGWDTYDSAVVIAENEDTARHTHPSAVDDWWKDNYYTTDWARPEDVNVSFIGTTDEDPQVICASFNAG